MQAPPRGMRWPFNAFLLWALSLISAPWLKCGHTDNSLFWSTVVKNDSYNQEYPSDHGHSGFTAYQLNLPCFASIAPVLGLQCLHKSSQAAILVGGDLRAGKEACEACYCCTSAQKDRHYWCLINLQCTLDGALRSRLWNTCGVSYRVVSLWHYAVPVL